MKSKAQLQLYSAKNPAPVDLQGKWANELGSVMSITKQNGNSFSGEYTSKVSGTNKEVTGTLSGTIARDAIGFTVNWEPALHSVTSWSGKLLVSDQGSPLIYTLWQLSVGINDPKELWESILAGADIFTQLA